MFKGLSVRANNILEKARIETLDELVIRFRKPSDARKFRNCGFDTGKEILDYLFNAYLDGEMNEETEIEYLMPL